MDAQDFRSLQEAYLEVYELDEAKVDTGLSDVAKKDIRSRRYVSQTKGSEGVKNYDAMGSNASNWVSAERRRVHKTSRGVRKEEINLFDYLLEYLVAEGYADTNKAAIAIMANMSEEWKQSIVEGTKRTEYLQKKFNKENERKSGSAHTAISGKQNTGQALQKARQSERHMRGEN